MNNDKINNIIKTILNESLGEKNISQIIKQTEREYREANHCTLFDINNGLCEEFAQTVIERMGGYSNNLYELSGDMFFTSSELEHAKENWKNVIESDYGVWSADLLKHWGYPPNIDLNVVNDELNHTWICFNGRHYDAEASNGVDNWYDLPFNRKFFNRFKKQSKF